LTTEAQRSRWLRLPLHSLGLLFTPGFSQVSRDQKIKPKPFKRFPVGAP